MSVCPVSSYIAACTDKVISIYSAKANSPIEWVLDIKADEVKKVVLYDRYLGKYMRLQIILHYDLIDDFSVLHRERGVCIEIED